jgi:poly-gamma-glutamate synthesis protein (capsule biosynthesis protein)
MFNNQQVVSRSEEREQITLVWPQEKEGFLTGSESEETDSTATSQEVSSEEEKDRLVEITISAAGDVSLGNHRDQGFSYSFREKYAEMGDRAYFFENVAPFFEEDDFTIVNLEGVLTFAEEVREGRTFYIKGDPEYANILTLGGVEAVSMSNNHVNDYGEQGKEDTIDALTAEGIGYAYDNILGLYEVKGILIGYVSVNETSMGTRVESYLQEGINALKDQGADLILASCHWGTEHVNYPEEYQITLGRNCIDWGADLVIGHHPHVLQGIEYYQGKYIIYSLANFCFGANRNPVDKDTIIYQQTFTFVDNDLQEETTAKVIPCSISSVETRNDYRPTPAIGEEAERILERMRQYSLDGNLSFAEDGEIIPASP